MKRQQVKLSAEDIYKRLRDDFGFNGAKGSVRFSLGDFKIKVEQNNIIGNILEEWLGKWMSKEGIAHIHNERQSSPDFWLDPDDKETNWLEIKSFTGSPNFDIAAFRSFINLILDKPQKLHSKYLLIKYTMQDGTVTIDDFWLKNIWEICCPSERYPIKAQVKQGVIVNIRPATWYSAQTANRTFQSLEHFLSALEQTIYTYHETRHLAENWMPRLISSYKRTYEKELQIPRWMDIKEHYTQQQASDTI